MAKCSNPKCSRDLRRPHFVGGVTNDIFKIDRNAQIKYVKSQEAVIGDSLSGNYLCPFCGQVCATGRADAIRFLNS